MSLLNEHEIIGQDEVKRFCQDILTDSNDVKLRLGGYSMFPNLMPGDIAAIRRVDSADLRVGQIVVAEIAGRWIAHRLVGLKTADSKTILILQGDSAAKPDAPISVSDVIGVVEEVERAGKMVVSSAFVAWFYISFRPVPQCASRLVHRISRKIKKLS